MWNFKLLQFYVYSAIFFFFVNKMQKAKVCDGALEIFLFSAYEDIL